MGKRLLLILAALLLASVQAAHAGGRINLATISGSINPASADFLIHAIQTSEEEGVDALLIELDTPGGLVSSTKDILVAMLNSEVPIIVYVAPRGAWASSAGTFITVAAHVAAMAPGTSIGAAHPVSIGGGGGKPSPIPMDPDDKDADAPPAGRDFALEKAENFLAAYMETIAKERNRNVEWVGKAVRESVAIGEDEALELNVIDLVAENRGELLKAIDGRKVRVAGEEQTLAVADAAITTLTMTPLQSLFNFLADPNIAMLLFLAGLAGLYIEFNSPGLIIPGVAGAVCLVLTAIAFQILPFSWVGLILILAGVGLLVAEVFVTSFGLLFVAGIACFLLGGSMIFDRPSLSDLTVSFWTVLVPAVVAVAIFGGIIVFSIGRTFGMEQTAGVGELVGLVGRAVTRLEPEGKVFVRGEYWTVQAEQAVDAGEAVEVVAVEGLKLRVRRTSG